MIVGHCRSGTGQDLPVAETLALVDNAEGSDVSIRNATALRYAVGVNLWEDGLRLAKWVQDTFVLSNAVHTETDA